MAIGVVALRHRVVVAWASPAGAIFRRRLCVAPQGRRSLQQQDTTRPSRGETASGPTPGSVAEGLPAAAAKELPGVKGDDSSVLADGKTGGSSATPAAAPADAAGGAAAGGAAEGEGKAAASPTTADDELWIVGRVLQRFDDRLGAKQDRIREAELGVIDRYASLISSLDSSLEAREDDEFLAWLDSSRASPASAASTDSAPSEGVDGSGDGSAAASDGRHRVEQFISDAAARLDTLVAHKQDMLFRDRDLRIGKDGDNGATAAAAEAGTGTETGAQAGEAATAATALPEDELYQIHVTAHRTMLSKCLSLVSESLNKQHLKPGLTVEEVAAATRAAYLAGPEDRLEALFPLFDAHGDGYLDAESVERVVDTVILPVTATAERLYAAAARAALDKKAAGAMPKTMKYTLWDVLEVPVKRRCAFAWAEERKQVGPDEWRISWEQFKPSRRVNFPEFESVAANYLAEYRRRRSAWHNTRKGRRRAAIYGTALFTTVVFLDNFLATV